MGRYDEDDVPEWERLRIRTTSRDRDADTDTDLDSTSLVVRPRSRYDDADAPTRARRSFRIRPTDADAEATPEPEPAPRREPEPTPAVSSLPTSGVIHYGSDEHYIAHTIQIKSGLLFCTGPGYHTSKIIPLSAVRSIDPLGGGPHGHATPTTAQAWGERGKPKRGAY